MIEQVLFFSPEWDRHPNGQIFKIPRFSGLEDTITLIDPVREALDLNPSEIGCNDNRERLFVKINPKTGTNQGRNSSYRGKRKDGISLSYTGSYKKRYNRRNPKNCNTSENCEGTPSNICAGQSIQGSASSERNTRGDSSQGSNSDSTRIQ